MGQNAELQKGVTAFKEKKTTEKEKERLYWTPVFFVHKCCKNGKGKADTVWPWSRLLAFGVREGPNDYQLLVTPEKGGSCKRSGIPGNLKKDFRITG